jgi:hypothetical protein
MKVRVLIAAGAAVMAVAVVAAPAVSTTGFKRGIPQVVSAAAAPASQTNTLLQQ